MESKSLDAPQTDALEIRNIPHKGRGVFAKRRFEQGERIESVPVIPLAPSEEPGESSPTLYHYAYGWGIDNRESAIALGYGSIYNHSYVPNAYYVRNLPKEQIDYIALKQIEIGEEITVNYNGSPEDKTPVWFETR